MYCIPHYPLKLYVIQPLLKEFGCYFSFTFLILPIYFNSLNFLTFSSRRSKVRLYVRAEDQGRVLRCEADNGLGLMVTTNVTLNVLREFFSFSSFHIIPSDIMRLFYISLMHSTASSTLFYYLFFSFFFHW